MPNYRRIYIPGQPVFITILTYHRKRVFSNTLNINILLETMECVKTYHTYDLLAYVIIPDHVHLMIQTPDTIPNYSPVIHSIKRNYVWNFKKHYHIMHHINIWHSRFWDHVIRDENDFEKHMDYIHWNPVKHAIVTDPVNWEWSSIHRYCD